MTYTLWHIHTLWHTNTSWHIHTLWHTNTGCSHHWTQTQTHSQVCIYTCMYIHIHVYVYMYMDTYVYIQAVPLTEQGASASSRRYKFSKVSALLHSHNITTTSPIFENLHQQRTAQVSKPNCPTNFWKVSRYCIHCIKQVHRSLSRMCTSDGPCGSWGPTVRVAAAVERGATARPWHSQRLHAVAARAWSSRKAHSLAWPGVCECVEGLSGYVYARMRGCVEVGCFVCSWVGGWMGESRAVGVGVRGFVRDWGFLHTHAIVVCVCVHVCWRVCICGTQARACLCAQNKHELPTNCANTYTQKRKTRTIPETQIKSARLRIDSTYW